MIGRTLDAILSVVQGIGKEIGSESLLFNLASNMRNVILPVRPQRLIKDDNNEIKSFDDDLYWNEYDFSSGQIKRLLAKAFEKRRKVKVGETFTLEKQRYRDTGMGVIVPISYEVKRVEKNIAEVTGFWGWNKSNSTGEFYVISNLEEALKQYNDSGFVPVRYKFVI